MTCYVGKHYAFVGIPETKPDRLSLDIFIPPKMAIIKIIVTNSCGKVYVKGIIGKITDNY